MIKTVQNQTKINFDPVKHLYTDDNGNVYTSVTTLIGKYKPPFDKKYWGMYTALKNSGFKVVPSKVGKVIKVDGTYRSIDSLYQNPINCYEVELLMKEWKRLTDIACERGNNIHDFLEDSINESKDDYKGKTNDIIKPTLQLEGQILTIKTQHDLEKTGIQDRYPSIYIRLSAYIKMGCTLFAEKKVFSTHYQVAGMIDVLVVHLKTKQFCIVDWKTNKDIMMFESGYFKKEYINGNWIKGKTFVSSKKYLKAPLNTVEDCKGMIYTLQLSLYAYILILWGYKLVKNGLEIFHIRPNETPKLIKVPFLQKEIHNMLEHHYKYRVSTNSHQGTLFGIK